MGSSLRLKGDVQVISLAPGYPTFPDYVRQVGKEKPLTRDLLMDLAKEKVIDQYAYGVHRDANQQIIDRGNIVLNLALTRMVNWAIGASAVPIAVCGVGSSNTTPTLTDTDNNAPILPRQNVTSSYLVGGAQANWDTSFAAGANQGTWHEAGLFDDLSGGLMASHALFNTPVTKGPSNQVIVEWQWSFISG